MATVVKPQPDPSQPSKPDCLASEELVTFHKYRYRSAVRDVLEADSSPSSHEAAIRATDDPFRHPKA